MDTENPAAAPSGAVGPSQGRPLRSPTVWPARARWLVHLGLLASFAAAFGTLQFLHIRNAIHADVGLVFAALVIVHLAQRRHRLVRMCTKLGRLRPFRPWVERELRLLASDALFAVITVNVIVSGVLDWGRGAPLLLPFPAPFQRWHLTSSAVLVVYLAVHVARRRKRLRRSTIR
jgi:hypothetical protein